MNSKNQYCLSIDQGTFSSRAVLFTQSGQIVYSAQQSISLNRLDDKHIEQEANELLASVRYVIKQVLSKSGIDSDLIKTAGLSTQRSSLLAWKPSTGEAISPVLSWQDTRAADWLKNFSHHKGFIQKRTGLYPNAHYGASKIQWLLKYHEDVQSALSKNDCVITPLVSYILFNVSDRNTINIDIANASRTLLCNLFKKAWDKDLLKLFEIQKQWLPRCRPIIYDYGNIKRSSIKISAVNGDQTSALYSNGNPDDSTLKINLGTGAFVLTTFEQHQLESEVFTSSNLLAGISNNTADLVNYYIEGTVNGAGSAIQWLQDELQLADIGLLMPAQEYVNTDSYIFINSIGGFGSPVWRSDISPCFVDGKNNKVYLTPQQSLVAVLESIIFLLVINIRAIAKLKKTIHKIEISGGLSNVDYVCQSLANLSHLSVHRSEDTEATARGICWLALPDKTRWETIAMAKEFSAADDAALESRFNHFKNYLQEKHAVSLP